jgi:hypothetical protein
MNGSLRRKITLNGWTKQKWCSACAEKNESARQQRHAREKAALAARVGAL